MKILKNRKRALLWGLTSVGVLLLAAALAFKRSQQHPAPDDTWPPLAKYLAAHQSVSEKVDETSQYVAMRDGVRIAVSTMLPPNLQPGHRIPALLRSAHYWRRWDWDWPARVALDDPNDPGYTMISNGYAMVNMDLRGTGASFGNWRPFSDTELDDGRQITDWIVKQPWSNGSVGVWGLSVEASSALLQLANHHPAVKACVFDRGLFDVYEDIAHPGGMPAPAGVADRLHFFDSNQLPPGMAPPWYLRHFLHGVRPVDGPDGRDLLAQALIDHRRNADPEQMGLEVTFRDDVVDSDGRKGSSISPSGRLDAINSSGVPVLILQGWFDRPDGGLRTYAALKNPRRLIIGPWNHELQDGSPFAQWHGAGYELRGEFLRFFDHYLKNENNGYEQLPRIQYFAMGSEQWREVNAWPPPAEKRSYYLQTEGGLAVTRPPLAGSPEIYRVNTLFNSVAGPFSSPQNFAEENARGSSEGQLPHYTSVPLIESVEITGTPEMHLWVSSTTADGEFLAYLEDVDQHGSVQYVSSGQLRAICRKLNTSSADGDLHSYLRADALPLVPGQPAEVVFQLAPTSYQFRQGHRIRITLSGADARWFAALAGPAPVWKIYRGSTRASMLVLPVNVAGQLAAIINKSQ